MFSKLKMSYCLQCVSNGKKCHWFAATEKEKKKKDLRSQLLIEPLSVLLLCSAPSHFHFLHLCSLVFVVAAVSSLPPPTYRRTARFRNQASHSFFGSSVCGKGLLLFSFLFNTVHQRGTDAQSLQLPYIFFPSVSKAKLKRIPLSNCRVYLSVLLSPCSLLSVGDCIHSPQTLVPEPSKCLRLPSP